MPGRGRPAASAPSSTRAAASRAGPGGIQFSSTASACSPASRHICGPRAASTISQPAPGRSSAIASRTRRSGASPVPLPMPSRNRERGKLFSSSPARIDSGDRWDTGITPVPSPMREVAPATRASSGSASPLGGWLSQNVLKPAPSAAHAVARMVGSGAATASPYPICVIGRKVPRRTARPNRLTASAAGTPRYHPRMAGERELTLVEAVREALLEEMGRDDRVVLLGEDIGRLGGVFRATDGLLDRFGPERVVDSPMAELSIAGIAVGLAMRGLRPVAEIQFADFIHAAADHLIGEAAKIRYRTAGDWTCPMVVRTAWGGGFRGGPYHSQSVEAFYCHVPGLKVVAPSFAADAKGLLTASIRDPDPVLFLEHKMTYRRVRGPVPEGEHVEELGRAKTVRKGDAVTICAWGLMLHEALTAAGRLAAEGVECEVQDLRTLLPLDTDTLLASVRRTGRLCVVHEDTRTMGLGAELAARVAEAALEDLRAPVMRVAMADVAGIPASGPMEDFLIPDRERIGAAVRELAGIDHGQRTSISVNGAVLGAAPGP